LFFAGRFDSYLLRIPNFLLSSLSPVVLISGFKQGDPHFQAQALCVSPSFRFSRLLLPGNPFPDGFRSQSHFSDVRRQPSCFTPMGFPRIFPFPFFLRYDAPPTVPEIDSKRNEAPPPPSALLLGRLRNDFPIFSGIPEANRGFPLLPPSASQVSRRGPVFFHCSSFSLSPLRSPFSR